VTPPRPLVRHWPPLLTLLLLLLLLFPYYWLVISSLKPVDEVFSIPPRFWPQSPTLDNFVDVLGRPKIRRFFLNSMVITGSTVLLNLTLASMAAFALSTFRFRGRRTLILATLATQLFPAVIVVIPLYRLWATLGLLNTFQALVSTYIAFTLPLGIWMLTGYMRTIPYEVVEAALVDGCSRPRLFLEIVLPLARPGLAATAVYVALVSWNEFIFALTFSTSEEVRTVTVGLYSFIGEFVYDWNLLLAMAVAMSVPIAVVFLLLQRFLVSGLTAGATKG